MQFFEFCDNTFDTRGFAEPEAIVTPPHWQVTDVLKCSACGSYCGEVLDNYYDKDIEVQVDKKKGTKWPDIARCSTAFILVSQRVLEIWESEGVGTIPCFPAQVVPPFPKTLTTEPPMYYRLNYKKMVGCELNFEASGYVNARACEGCGGFAYDITQTYDKQNSKIFPYVIKPDTWNGTHIFCPRMPERRMFCTDKVVDVAHKYKLTNFRFVPLEIGKGISFNGVDYSKKNWRAKMEKQVEEYRQNFRPRDPETGQYVK